MQILFLLGLLHLPICLYVFLTKHFPLLNDYKLILNICRFVYLCTLQTYRNKKQCNLGSVSDKHYMPRIKRIFNEILDNSL